MKIVLILLLFQLGINLSVGQTESFKNAWTKTQNFISSIDSSCSYVVDENYSFRRKFSFLSLRPDNYKQKHSLKVKYKNGNIIVRHRYRIGLLKCKIDVLTINGQIVFIRSKYKPEGSTYKITNTFINLGNKTWQWTSQNNDNKLRTTRELTNNWH